MKAARALKGAAGIAAAMALWEITRALGLIDARDLPSVLDIVRSGFANSRDLGRAALGTLGVWAAGLAVATVLGGAAGIALALVPWLERITRPLIEFMRPIPSVALIPVALIVIGLGFRMEVTLIAFASIWPVLFNTKAGVESVDPRFVETGRILGLDRASIVARIVLPAALPAMATGVRTAAAIGLVLAITVEMLTGDKGLGSFLQLAALNGQFAQMWAATMFAGVIGLVLNAMFLAAERRMLVWSVEHRAS
ncbi:MAG TPA: ABC transporter permease [Casimicrobiaceae bacterium]|jgi:NitT/TauT family transport system permease protein|nr:ABC transporter permease [Casimicrobiaceae bacterium]